MGAQLPRSPLAPDGFPDLPRIGGLSVATAEAGLRYSGRPDVMPGASRASITSGRPE